MAGGQKMHHPHRGGRLNLAAHLILLREGQNNNKESRLFERRMSAQASLVTGRGAVMFINFAS